MTPIFDKLKDQLNRKLPFVVYNKPSESDLIGIFQKNAELYHVEDFNERGFVFAPFDGDQIVLIPESNSEILMERIDFSTQNEDSINSLSANEDSKTAHETLVDKAIKAINDGHFEKVVLSRKEIIDYPELDLPSLFKKLLNAYPSAFTYCWFHPQVGLWLGAFSEQLLREENGVFQTMSVAGTQPFLGSEDVIWQSKEKQEQEFVTDFILENIKDIISEIKISDPYTLKAGNLLHIKTDIQGVLNDRLNLKRLINVLHPTPAVCGFPKTKAKEFILENENHDREYYSGFLGELNRNYITELFVNLRCMQIKNNQVHLYMGGGITKDSIAEKEWAETVNKSMTIKKVIS